MLWSVLVGRADFLCNILLFSVHDMEGEMVGNFLSPPTPKEAKRFRACGQMPVESGTIGPWRAASGGPWNLLSISDSQLWPQVSCSSRPENMQQNWPCILLSGSKPQTVGGRSQN